MNKSKWLTAFVTGILMVGFFFIGEMIQPNFLSELGWVGYLVSGVIAGVSSLLAQIFVRAYKGR